MPFKVLVVLGTRPEAIKLAPVILQLRASPEIACRVCVTGQHREMLDDVLGGFDIRPDADLELMRPKQELADLTARAIVALDAHLRTERPDLVVAQGDTTTVLATSIAALYQRVPLGHVEAGLRTGDLSSPWPEEANRVVTSHLARLHFAPTEPARQNLLREGIPSDRIFVTGNTVIDALLLAREHVRAAKPVIAGLPHGSTASFGDAPVVLVTGHRRESFGASFDAICRAIAELAIRFPNALFVYPVHLNPSVREPVNRILVAAGLPNLHLIAPLGYLPFVALMDRATVVLTDSGGIQEEAPSLGKPVLVMRSKTDRPEAVAAGAARLVGADFDGIVRETSRLLESEAARKQMTIAKNPYGDGAASQRVVEGILGFLSALLRQAK